MTPQQIYNKVAKHLLKQGRKSSLMGTCMYRGPDGCKCAIGPLIPDKLYETQMEHKTVIQLCRAYKWFRDQFADHSYLLSELQSVHDACLVRSWRRRLRQVALEFDLKPVE